MQYGTAAKMPATTCLPSWLFRPSSVSRIDLGWPGRLMTSEPLRTTATCRERIAVGTNSRLMRRICSPNPVSSSSFAVIFGHRLRIRDDIAQRAEQLAIGSRRQARGALLARVAHQRAQALGVHARMGANQCADRAVVLQQLLAPALDAVNSRGRIGRDPVPGPQLLPDRFRIYVAHKP